MRPIAAITVRISRIRIVTTFVTDSEIISTLYVIFERMRPLEFFSKNFTGSFKNFSKTSLLRELITPLPIQPREASVAKPDIPLNKKTAMKAIGSHLVASIFFATKASSISGSIRATIVISINAVPIIAIRAIKPISLYGLT